MLNNIHHVNNVKYKDYSYIVAFIAKDSNSNTVVSYRKENYSIFNLLYIQECICFLWYGTFVLQFEFYSIISIPFYSRVQWIFQLLA